MSSSLLHDAALCAAVLVPVLLGIQRQFPQERAGLSDPVQARRAPTPKRSITLAAAVFIAPFFFLSALGGEIADRYDKADRGAAAQACRDRRRLHRGARLLACTRCRSCSSRCSCSASSPSLFGPIKYGILPDHLHAPNCRPATRWSKARPSSPSCSAPSSAASPPRTAAIPAPFRAADDRVLADVLGREPVHPAHRRGAPDLAIQTNILASTGGLLQLPARRPAACGGARMVTSWFWLVGAVALSLLPPLVKNVLGGNEEVVTACLAIFSISIAIGSGLAAWLAAGRIILLPTLIGAVLLGMFALDLGWSTMRRDADRRLLTAISRRLQLRPRHPLRDRPCRPRDRRRPVHRAGLRGGAGLGRRRPPRARGRRASTCSMPRSWRAAR